MKVKKNMKKGMAAVLSMSMVLGLFPIMPGSTTIAKAAAAKSIAGLGTGIIADPTAPASTDDEWKGSYVYYGTYNGNPMKYRVLDSETTVFGGTTMLLDCDSGLMAGTYFDDNGMTNVWADSSIRTSLNGKFLTNNFSTAEADAIASSSKTEADSTDGNGKDNFSYAPLSGDKIFLLDAKEATNTSYGYSDTKDNAANRNKSDSYWWLRSPRVNSDLGVGYVYRSGSFDYEQSNVGLNVSPAFNVNLSSVLFSSVISGTAGETGAEYKLTLLDSNMTIAVNGDVTQSGDNLTVPYTISGTDSGNMTQISILITDKAYTDNDAKILYYDALDISAGNGTGTFALPSDISEDNYAYIIAEDVNGQYETDYASAPVSVSLHTHTYATELSYDKENHWYASTCGHTAAVKDKEAHTYGEWTSDNNATAASGGTKSRTCSVCNYKQTKLNAGASDFTYDSSTGTVSPASDKDLGTVTTYYKVNNSWTTTKPTTAGTYEVGVVTTESDDYAPAGTADEPFTDSSWKYVIWSCTANDNQITADCGEENVTLTLQASDATYSGSAYNGASLSGTEAWTKAGFTVPTITYVGRGTTAYTESETTPTNVGTYTAKITVEGQTASVDFTILKKDPDDISAGAFTKTDETIDGKQDGKIAGVSADYEYSTDNGSTWNDCTGSEITGLSSGTVNIRKKATDCYNASNAVDIVIAKGSKIVLSLPEDANYTVTCSPNEGVTYNGTAVLTFTPSDGYTVTEPLKLTVGGVETEFTKDGATGKYTATVKNVTDKDGLKVTAVSGYCDDIKPTGTVKISDKSFTSFLNTITFGIFFKETKQVTIEGADAGSGLKTVSYYIAKNSEAVTESSLGTLNWNVYTESFSIAPSAKYIIYVKLEDNAGNISYLCSDGIVMEDKAPVVTGIERNKTYCEATEFTVTDDYLESVKMDGEDISPVNGKYTLPADGTAHTVTAADKAGNVTTIAAVKANDGHTWSAWTSNNDATTEKDGTKTRTCSICGDEETVTDVGSKIHVHTYDTAWTSDANYHWHAATCGHDTEVSDKAAHVYDEWISDNNATATSGGTKSRTCSVCNYQQTKLNASTSDFTCDSSTGTVSPASDKNLGTITTYYKVNNSWTTTKPTTAGVYEVGVVTTESDDYAPTGTANEPLSDSSWKYVVWSCTADGNIITADCGEKNVSITLQASDATYSGSAYNGASLSGTEAWLEAGFTVPSITYVGRGTTVYAESEIAPTNGGSYTAKITVEGQTASVDFTIAKKNQDDISSAAFAKTDETIDGKHDGKITGVSTDYEYSTDGGSTWNDCTGNEITGLASGTVNIRKKETGGYNASNTIDIVIAKGSKIVLSLPEDANYTVTCSPKDGVTYNGTAVLTFTPSDGYTVTEPLKLTVGGVETEFTKDESTGKYIAIVKNITDKDGLKVTAVSGYGESKDTGTVNIPEEKQNGNFAAGGIKNSVTEAKKAVLTDEDKAAMAEGKDVNIWVEVKDQSSTVSDSDKTAVSAKLPTNYVVGAYLDINLWKQITGSDAIKVTQTSNGKLKIGFTIPESLQKTGRDYKIIRLHDGVADVLDVTVDENYELTFETDRFSTYALVYTDTDNASTTDTTADTGSTTDASASNTLTAATSPKTGDTTNMELYLLMLLAGVAGVAGSFAKRRKECNR